MILTISTRVEPDGYEHTAVEAIKIIDILGYKFFTRIAEYDDGDRFYKVTDYDSGFCVADGDTEEDAIQSAYSRLCMFGIDCYISARDKSVAKYGRANP